MAPMKTMHFSIYRSCLVHEKSTGTCTICIYNIVFFSCFQEEEEKVSNKDLFLQAIKDGKAKEFVEKLMADRVIVSRYS